MFILVALLDPLQQLCILIVLRAHRPGHRPEAPDGASQRQSSQWDNPVSLPAAAPSVGAVQGTDGVLGCRHTLLACIKILVVQQDNSQDFSQWVFLPVCTHPWDCSDSSATPCTWPYRTSLCSHRPAFWACPGPSECHPFRYVNCTTPLGSSVNLLRVSLIPLPGSLIEMLNSSGHFTTRDRKRLLWSLPFFVSLCCSHQFWILHSKEHCEPVVADRFVFDRPAECINNCIVWK